MKFNIKLEEIKYVTISYYDKTNSECTTRAGVKKYDEKFVYATAKFEDGLNIETPQRVTIKFVCSDGVYFAETILDYIKNDAPYTFFTLLTPKEVDFQQKREFFRVPAEYECTYKLLKYNIATEYKTKTHDISAGGISIILPNQEDEEKITEINININGKILNLPVFFVRSIKKDDIYIASYKYNKIAEATRDLISQTCFKLQLAERRNSLK